MRITSCTSAPTPAAGFSLRCRLRHAEAQCGRQTADQADGGLTVSMREEHSKHSNIELLKEQPQQWLPPHPIACNQRRQSSTGARKRPSGYASDHGRACMLHESPRKNRPSPQNSDSNKKQCSAPPPAAAHQGNAAARRGLGCTLRLASNWSPGKVLCVPQLQRSHSRSAAATACARA